MGSQRMTLDCASPKSPSRSLSTASSPTMRTGSPTMRTGPVNSLEKVQHWGSAKMPKDKSAEGTVPQVTGSLCCSSVSYQKKASPSPSPSRQNESVMLATLLQPNAEVGSPPLGGRILPPLGDPATPSAVALGISDSTPTSPNSQKLPRSHQRVSSPQMLPASVAHVPTGTLKVKNNKVGLWSRVDVEFNVEEPRKDDYIGLYEASTSMTNTGECTSLFHPEDLTFSGFIIAHCSPADDYEASLMTRGKAVGKCTFISPEVPGKFCLRFIRRDSEVLSSVDIVVAAS